MTLALSAGDEFRALLAERAVKPVFQPIVSLDDQRPVGFEALARGPEKSRLFMPEALFAEAERCGASAELDWVCATAACAAAFDAGLYGVPLFVNLDPATFGTSCPPDLLPVFERGLQELDLILEITERAIEDPAALLHAVVGARRVHSRIALDDVGVNPASIGMISVLSPDVIKFDRAMIQASAPSWARNYVINAVLSEAQVTGAAVLCEGIETHEHLAAARAMGATLGQGWLFGRPGPLPDEIELSATSLPRVKPYPEAARTPFDAVRDRARTSRMSLPMLAPMKSLLEDVALHTGAAHLLFAALPESAAFDDESIQSYTRIAQRGVTVAVFGPNLPARFGSGVQAVSLSPEDPVAAEHAVITVGSYFAAALIARPSEPEDDVPAEPPLYDVVLTYDRRLAIEALHTLVDRLPRP
ncbi:EAL domain-containing protein [Hamadaea sp. NPDC051192]|uniref:sensor domain-containing phosphodiesterase n=1 Tax=Hamadaea sp. NPDC051192 TaxID=3154940 RepID=UPI00342925E1